MTVCGGSSSINGMEEYPINCVVVGPQIFPHPEVPKMKDYGWRDEHGCGMCVRVCVLGVGVRGGGGGLLIGLFGPHFSFLFKNHDRIENTEKENA